MRVFFKKYVMLMLCYFPLISWGNNWYIRLDAGYSSILNAQMTMALESPPIYTSDPFTLNVDPNGTLAGLAGVGYQLGEYLRFDLTIQEYMMRRYESVCNEGGQTFCVNGTQRGFLETDMEFVNAYWELGPYLPDTFKKFKPYVGAGIGMATSYTTKTNFYQDDEYVMQVSSGTKASLAGRGIVGLAYMVLDKLAIDGWYTFTHAGHMQTGVHVLLGELDNERAYASQRGSMVMNMNEFYIGLRYLF